MQTPLSNKVFSYSIILCYHNSRRIIIFLVLWKLQSIFLLKRSCINQSVENTEQQGAGVSLRHNHVSIYPELPHHTGVHLGETKQNPCHQHWACMEKSWCLWVLHFINYIKQIFQKSQNSWRVFPKIPKPSRNRPLYCCPKHKIRKGICYHLHGKGYDGILAYLWCQNIQIPGSMPV